MDGFELNKIAAAFLLALVIGMVAHLTADGLIAPKQLAHNVYIVSGIEQKKQGAVRPAEESIPPIEPLLAAANVQNGAVIAKKCVQCHTFDKGGPNRMGPNLWGIVTNKMAHAEGFPYSKALEEKKGIWTFENLNHFIYKPRSFIAGTKMSFAGLQKPQDRADVIAYLNTLSDSPQPLPTGKQGDKKTQETSKKASDDKPS